MPRMTIGQWDTVPVTTLMQKALPMIAVTSPNKPRFESRMSFPVSGFEFAPMTVTLYEVHALEGDQFCETCFRIRRSGSTTLP